MCKNKLQCVKTVQRFLFFTQILSKYAAYVDSSSKQKLCTIETTKEPADIYLFEVNHRTFEEGVKMFEGNDKDSRKAPLKSRWCHYC